MWDGLCIVWTTCVVTVIGHSSNDLRSCEVALQRCVRSCACSVALWSITPRSITLRFVTLCSNALWSATLCSIALWFVTPFSIALWFVTPCSIQCDLSQRDLLQCHLTHCVLLHSSVHDSVFYLLHMVSVIEYSITTPPVTPWTGWFNLMLQTTFISDNAFVLWALAFWPFALFCLLLLLV